MPTVTNITPALEADRAAFLEAVRGPEGNDAARRLVDALIAWSARHERLLRHHAVAGGEPSITFRLTRTGYVGWTVQPDGEGDGRARLVLLPRSMAALPAPVQAELRGRLDALGVFVPEGAAPAVPLAALATADCVKALVATLDWIIPLASERG